MQSASEQSFSCSIQSTNSTDDPFIVPMYKGTDSCDSRKKSPNIPCVSIQRWKLGSSHCTVVPHDWPWNTVKTHTAHEKREPRWQSLTLYHRSPAVQFHQAPLRQSRCDSESHYSIPWLQGPVKLLSVQRREKNPAPSDCLTTHWVPSAPSLAHPLNTCPSVRGRERERERDGRRGTER